MKRKRLLFVSTRFLFPVDSGGKVRTSQVLRGLKGGSFEITLVSPATPNEIDAHRADLNTVCDRFVSWTPKGRSPLHYYTRLRHLLNALPISVHTDWSSEASQSVESALSDCPDVVVFDFLHSVVLAPPELNVPSVLFTHNVESEIFERHRGHASNLLTRWFWTDQLQKMLTFEGAATRRFDVVVAVSDRDRSQFRSRFDVRDVHVIPTGVDLDFFAYNRPSQVGPIVFLGSMDWLANQDAVSYFMDDVWPLIVREEPRASMLVVGRAPPSLLVRRAQQRTLPWTFTGYVDDVRPHMFGASACVIPMRIGGGTRLKVFESMAMGVPVVSTQIGVEGLPIRADEHCLVAEDPDSFATAVVRLLRDESLRTSISKAARSCVEDRFSHREAARVFALGCDLAIERRGTQLRVP